HRSGAHGTARDRTARGPLCAGGRHRGGVLLGDEGRTLVRRDRLRHTIMLATIALVVMGLMARPTADQGEALSAADIFRRVEHANASRAEKLQAYSSLRRYAVLEPGHEADAELVVSMQFVAPSTKSFKTLAATGVGWIHNRVFRGLMDAERQAAVGA